MNIDDFIRKVEEEFEDVQPNSLIPEDKLRDKFTWDSINALIFLAHVNVEYDVELTAEELVNLETVQDLYDLVKLKVDNK